MGRPPASTVRRLSVIRSVRLTQAEARLLADRFGSVSRALRALVNAYLRGELASRTDAGG